MITDSPITHNIVVFGLFIVGAILLGLAIRDYKKSSASISSYFLMDGSLRLPLFIATYLSTNWSLGNLVWFSAVLGYFYGFSYMVVLFVGYIVMVWVYFRYLPQFQDYIEDRDNVGSLHEYISQRYTNSSDSEGSFLRLLSSIPTVLGLLVALVLEIYLAALLLDTTLGIPASEMMVGLVVLIAIYTCISGFWSVVVTDLVQALLQIAGFIALFSIFWHFGDAFSFSSDQYTLNPIGMLRDFGFAGTLSIFTIVSGFYLVTMDTWQRSAASRSVETTKTGMIVSTVLVFFSNFVFVMLGMFDNLFIRSEFPTFGSLTHSGGNNPLADLFLLGASGGIWIEIALGGIAIALVMAAISTADTLLVISSHSFVSDMVIGANWRSTYGQLNRTESRSAVNLARATVIVVGLLVIGTWKLLEWTGALFDPLTLFFISFSLQYVLLAPVLFSKGNKLSANVAIFSIAVGLTVSLASGFGGFVASGYGVETIFGLAPSEWSQLSPVLTVCVGIATIILARLVYRNRG